VIDDPSPSLVTRLLLAWLCFFRVLFDGRFAARVRSITDAPLRVPAAPPSASRLDPSAEESGATAAIDAGWPTPDAVPSPPPMPPATPAAAPPTPLTPPTTPAPPATSALQLLSLLQREGRLVDFLQQDITAFPDADVGTAARVVHEGCRRALRAHAAIEPVLGEEEGARVQLAAGFDADAVTLVGDVRGEPPYAGVVRHCGWRATRFELPQIVGGHDANVLAPAEVEVG
jgi:hypothetical protein